MNDTLERLYDKQVVIGGGFNILSFLFGSKKKTNWNKMLSVKMNHMFTKKRKMLKNLLFHIMCVCVDMNVTAGRLKYTLDLDELFCNGMYAMCFMVAFKPPNT